jgi:hypothetical protein
LGFLFYNKLQKITKIRFLPQLPVYISFFKKRFHVCIMVGIYILIPRENNAENRPIMKWFPYIIV